MFKKYYIFIFILLIVVFNVIPTPFYLVIPGQGLNLDKCIHAENGDRDAKGSFILTSTSVTRANILLYLYSYIDRQIELLKIDSGIFGQNYWRDYHVLMDKLMLESQRIAKVVALEKAGYFPEIIKNEGILVTDILNSSPAKNKLLPGDIITRVNDAKVNNLSDFSECLNGFCIGELVKIYFKRNEKLYSTKVPVIDLNQDKKEKEIQGIGIFLTPIDLQFNFPLEVTINIKDIKGSSAGLMIALEILNQLTENDLSNGLTIAGTGALDLDGNITSVTGVRQKLISAKKNDADIFLVPKDNYEEIAHYESGIRIIPVENFDDAIMRLIKL